MKLRTVLIAASVVGMLFGLMFLLAPDKALESFNLSTNDVTRLFARSLGGLLIGISVINWLSQNDTGSFALRGVVIGNVIIHVLSVIVDFTLHYERQLGTWISLLVHVFFIIAFGYYWLNWNKVTKD